MLARWTDRRTAGCRSPTTVAGSCWWLMQRSLARLIGLPPTDARIGVERAPTVACFIGAGGDHPSRRVLGLLPALEDSPLHQALELSDHSGVGHGSQVQVMTRSNRRPMRSCRHCMAPMRCGASGPGEACCATADSGTKRVWSRSAGVTLRRYGRAERRALPKWWGQLDKRAALWTDKDGRVSMRHAQ